MEIRKTASDFVIEGIANTGIAMRIILDIKTIAATTHSCGW